MMTVKYCFTQTQNQNLLSLSHSEEAIFCRVSGSHFNMTASTSINLLGIKNKPHYTLARLSIVPFSERQAGSGLSS